jgi:hypothetical protein
MDTNNEDRFLEQIDSELRSVNNRLKKIISEAQSLLQEYSDQGKEEQEPKSDSDGQETNIAAEGTEQTEGSGHVENRGEA